ncbi:hypothetical protein THRCLA_07835 [Thraustotheca clavata]|uniref:Uncharacterized protein n=1 Tax=Thraustotheca clavata TaxID=74557 RepID=A0A1V9ZCA3_9STRA|nr:hypothetical protein THRCLA_07835 [Thraustotheca clavata]
MTIEYMHNYQDPWNIFLDWYLHECLLYQTSANLYSLALTSRTMLERLRRSPFYRLIHLILLRNQLSIIDDRNLRFIVHTEVRTACGITGKGFGVYTHTSHPDRIRSPCPAYLKDLHAEIWRLANATNTTHLEMTCAITKIHNCVCKGYYQPRLKVRLPALAMAEGRVEKHPQEPHAYIVHGKEHRWLVGRDMMWDQVFSVEVFRQVIQRDLDWWERHKDVQMLATAFGEIFEHWIGMNCPVVFQTSSCHFNLAPFHAEYTNELFVCQHDKLDLSGDEDEDMMELSDDEYMYD